MSSSTNTKCLMSGCPDGSQIGFGFGWVEKLLLVIVQQLLLVVVEQLFLAVVDQLLNPILLSNRDVKRSFAEVEITCMFSHFRLQKVGSVP